MLIAVKWQDWNANFSYCPPLKDGVINTEQIVSAVEAESRGSGPWTRVNFTDGTHMTVQGMPEKFLSEGSK